MLYYSIYIERNKNFFFKLFARKPRAERKFFRSSGLLRSRKKSRAYASPG